MAILQVTVRQNKGWYCPLLYCTALLLAIPSLGLACSTANWSAVTFDAAGRLSATEELPYSGSCSLRIDLADAAPRYVEDHSPAGIESYSAQFYFYLDSPSEAALVDGEALLLFTGVDADEELLFQVWLRQQGQQRQLILSARSGAQDQQGAPMTLVDGWSALQLHWRADAAQEPQQLSVTLHNGGEVQQRTLSALDNAGDRLALVRLGLVDSNSGAMAGVLFIDEFHSQLTGPLALQPSSNPAVDFDGDGMPDTVEVEEKTLFSARDNDVFGDARLFTRQQYRDFLLREGDSGGIDFWTGEFAAGRPQSDLVVAFLLSEEFFNQVAVRYPDPCGEFPATCNSFPALNDETPPFARYTLALYSGLLQRDPDAGGFDFWYRHFKNGAPLQSLAEVFLISPEYCLRFLPAEFCPT